MSTTCLGGPNRKGLTGNIVTTHSNILVGALSGHPKAIIVCEREQGGTCLKRLDPEEMKAWLDMYRLGELWLRGDIGGTRR